MEAVMRWRKGRQSQNIEDRRGQRSGMGAPRGIKLGGGMGILLLLVVIFLGGDPIQLLGMLGGGGADPTPNQQTRTPSSMPASDENARFVSAVLGFTEDTWSELFQRAGLTYERPKLVLYNGSTPTACGFGSAASGPFYCPGDLKVYIDLDFFSELHRLGASGDFAQAYVISHEVAHHVQNLLGTMNKVDRVRRNSSKADANALSVRLELQADCYAGVWAHHAQKEFDILERGDIEEGLDAASAVGDDRLQRMSGRGVHPESFTHGTSRQRADWFRNGLKNGSVEACNTFG
jgi:predicted metalloprotease